MVTIKVNGEERKYQKGTSLEVIAKDFQKDYDAQILIAIRNDKIKELAKKVETKFKCVPIGCDSYQIEQIYSDA